MLRKLVVLFAAVGLVVGMTTAASAGVFMAHDSTLSLNLGSLPTSSVSGHYGAGGYASLSNNGSDHDLSDTASIWQTTALSQGTSLLTGVGLITNLTITVANESGAFTPGFSVDNPVGGGAATPTPSSAAICPNGCLGGTEAFNGTFIVSTLLGPVGIDLGKMGLGGQTAVVLGPGVTINATFAPFVTGKVKITGVKTNVISIIDRAGITGVGVTLRPAATEEVRTFTVNGAVAQNPPPSIISTRASVILSGTNNLQSSATSLDGQVTLISPVRVDTGSLAGVIPGVASKTFVFADVPEPGTVLLLVSGAAGLVFLGRRRMR